MTSNTEISTPLTGTVLDEEEVSLSELPVRLRESSRTVAVTVASFPMLSPSFISECGG